MLFGIVLRQFVSLADSPGHVQSLYLSQCLVLFQLTLGIFCLVHIKIIMMVMSAVCLLHLLSHIWCGKLGGSQMDPFPRAMSLLAKSTC